MTKYQDQEKRLQSVSQDRQIRKLLLSLKSLSLAFLLTGIMLWGIFLFISVPKWMELSMLLIFSSSAALFLIVRMKTLTKEINKEPQNHIGHSKK